MRVREQAQLQVEGRRQHKAMYELLRPFEQMRDLALLPEPSHGDLFLDMEGDPFLEEGGSDGIDYLFGVTDTSSTFHAIWGTDRGRVSRARSRNSSTS